jgi:hypothetical protein
MTMSAYSIGREEMPDGSRPASAQPMRVATTGMAITMRNRLLQGTVEVDEEKRRAAAVVLCHGALDAIREIEPTSETGQHIGVHLRDQPPRADSDSLCTGGKNLRDEDPDGERKDKLDPDLGGPRSLDYCPRGPSDQSKEGPNSLTLGQSDENEHQGEESRELGGLTARHEQGECHFAGNQKDREAQEHPSFDPATEQTEQNGIDRQRHADRGDDEPGSHAANGKQHHREQCHNAIASDQSEPQQDVVFSDPRLGAKR